MNYSVDVLNNNAKKNINTVFVKNLKDSLYSIRFDLVAMKIKGKSKIPKTEFEALIKRESTDPEIGSALNELFAEFDLDYNNKRDQSKNEMGESKVVKMPSVNYENQIGNDKSRFVDTANNNDSIQKKKSDAKVLQIDFNRNVKDNAA